MSDIAQFTSVFRAQSLSDHRRVTKRNRQPVSCLACRARKLRCDRALPCGACSKRGDTCKFGPKLSSPTHDAVHGATGSQPKPRQEVQVRLQKLEDMVQDLVRKSTTQTVTPSTSGPDVDSPAVIPGDGDEAYYGATHWSAVLQHIREIQTALEPADDALPSPGEPPEGAACTIGPDFLFGAVPPAISMRDVLSSLPSRQDTDRLLGVYFRARFSAVPFIHAGRFQREYEAFWADPEATSFLWVSILFSVLAVAAIIIRARGRSAAAAAGIEGALRDPSAYSGRAVQCLIKGNYLAARRHSVEAALLVACTRNIASKDLDPILWNMFGVATRLAQRKGYHLDPKHLPMTITPFEAEMRRRAWFYCETFDLLLSFQLGVPAVIHESDTDARGPGNHPDEDFDETTAEMPPPRAALDPTPMLYYHWKSKLCRILRKVVRHALSPTEPPYEEVCTLDEMLHRWRRELPPSLAIRPIRTTGFSDAPYTIMHRLMLELMYSKALCVLHRAYLSRDKTEPRYARSRTTCRAAALRVLELHEEFDREASPGGRLFEDRYMLSSLTLHDFMIAATVICLDLNECSAASDAEYERKFAALARAERIWAKRSGCSRDARHAAAVLRAMLHRLQGRDASRSAATPEEEAFAFDPGFAQMQDAGAEFDFVALNNAMNDPASLDWSLLDQYLSTDRSGQLSVDVVK
ncbi:Fusarisetin A cluster transcription factor fsa6 [Colletotrichum sidae]|uniref:Fusarisetin A cluster transcription factor fsa6 n=1 Tax=Colletotrichum sidae TaxID=1347389 RepID=A0A4R8T979_9PEZI|nr:Fusarisetin A cluster transcription factor fsa6 [Colletotrichum sidae]